MEETDNICLVIKVVVSHGLVSTLAEEDRDAPAKWISGRLLSSDPKQPIAFSIATIFICLLPICSSLTQHHDAVLSWDLHVQLLPTLCVGILPQSANHVSPILQSVR
jgi:hypothetical protein